MGSALPRTLTLRLSFFKDDADGNSFEDDEDAEGYEPWSLASHHASQPAAAMAQRYELLGRKQGEEDLGEGRAGVVRKCLERLPEADEGQGQGQGHLLRLRCRCSCEPLRHLDLDCHLMCEFARCQRLCGRIPVDVARLREPVSCPSSTLLKDT